MIPEWLYSKKLTYRKEIRQILGIKFAFPRVTKTIAFVETQGLGDYILIHNFYKYVKQSKKYHDYNIILIARNNIASLAEAYDSMYINEFLYVDTRNAEKVLKNLKVEELVCSYNGLGKFEKWIFNNVKAKKRIIHGYGNKRANINIQTSNEQIFHRERMRMFYETLIEEKIPDDSLPYFRNEFADKNEKFIFISPFANDNMRTWGFDKYALLIQNLCTKYPEKIAILGEASQKKAIEKIIQHCSKEKGKIINTAGSFSVNSLRDVLKTHAKLLIGNETGTIHLGMTCNIPIVCISNGSFYGMYQPYKNNKIKYVYPSEFDYKYTCLSNLNINTIQVDKVFDVVNKLLNNQSNV